MCKNKYFNLISAVWSLGRGGTEELLPETASPASLCALCSRVVPALVLSVAQKQECKLFSFARQWANVHWKTDRLEIWGIKMPFAIIASPRKFMSICESLFCVVQKGNENCVPVEFSPGETKRLDTKSRRTQKAIVLKIEDEIGWLNVGSTQQLCVGKRLFVPFSSPLGWTEDTKTTPEKCIKV